MISSQHIFLSFAALCLLIALPSCWWSATQESAKQGLIVINVLDKALYDDCHIKGSINVSLDDLENFAKNVDKEHSEIVAYCSNYQCTTSEFVCKKLTAMGFKNVAAYEGGTAEWYQLGLPVEGPAKSPYLTRKLENPMLENNEIKVLTAQELAQKMGLK